MGSEASPSMVESSECREKRGRSVAEYFRECGVELESYLLRYARYLCRNDKRAAEVVARTNLVLVENWKRIEFPFAYGRMVVRSQVSRCSREDRRFGAPAGSERDPVGDIDPPDDPTVGCEEDSVIDHLEMDEFRAPIRAFGEAVTAALEDPATRALVPKRAPRGLDAADAVRAGEDYQAAVVAVATRLVRVLHEGDVEFARRFAGMTVEEILNTLLREEYPERFADEWISPTARHQWSRRGRVDVISLIQRLFTSAGAPATEEV